MRTSLNINIPEPCIEDWNKMTPQNKGRHCSSCKKTVYDFTSKTDEQIVKIYLNEGNVCGRFKSTQLNRELVLSRKEKNNFLSYVASTLFAFLSFGTHDVEAQGKPRIVTIDSSKQQTVNGKLGPSILNERIIKGFISSKLDGLPLPGVTVTNMRSKTETYSDFDGNYALKVKKGDTLSYSFVGLESIQKTVTNLNYLKTAMIEDECSLDVVIVGYSRKSQSYHREKCKENERKKIAKQERTIKRQKIKNGELERTTVGTFLYNITNIFRRKE